MCTQMTVLVYATADAVLKLSVDASAFLTFCSILKAGTSLQLVLREGLYRS